MPVDGYINYGISSVLYKNQTQLIAQAKLIIQQHICMNVWM